MSFAVPRGKRSSVAKKFDNHFLIDLLENSHSHYQEPSSPPQEIPFLFKLRFPSGLWKNFCPASISRVSILAMNGVLDAKTLQSMPGAYVPGIS